MRNRGTFMRCVAVLVVRRAGPERESTEDPHRRGQAISP